jgi:hypothetical protein
MKNNKEKRHRIATDNRGPKTISVFVTDKRTHAVIFGAEMRRAAGDAMKRK